MVAELAFSKIETPFCCSLAKISMVAELRFITNTVLFRCSLAKISMVAEPLAR